MATILAPRARSRNGVADKRGALLKAATELFAENGLQSVPTSAIARKAGVAKGTLFVYFETKEHLLNELYLEIVTEFISAVRAAVDLEAGPDVRLKHYWFAFARWYLSHSAAATVMVQCEVSSVLTPETQEKKQTLETEIANTIFPEVVARLEGSLLKYVGYAFIAGPIQVLAQMRDKGEIEISEDLLEETFIRFEKAFSAT